MSLNMELRRVSCIHFSQACTLCLHTPIPKARIATLIFKEFYKHPQVRRSLPKETYLYISIFGKILTSLLFPPSLVLYPLIYICFLPFCMCLSTPSPTLHILYLWLLLWVCFSRPFLPNTQFPVFDSLCDPPTYLRQSWLPSSPKSGDRVSSTLVRREQRKTYNIPLKNSFCHYQPGIDTKRKICLSVIKCEKGQTAKCICGVDDKGRRRDVLQRNWVVSNYKKKNTNISPHASLNAP